MSTYSRQHAIVGGNDDVGSSTSVDDQYLDLTLMFDDHHDVMISVQQGESFKPWANVSSIKQMIEQMELFIEGLKAHLATLEVEDATDYSQM